MASFAALLPRLPITEFTSWKEFQALYTSHEEFLSNSDYKEMDKIDFLVIFEEHVKKLEGQVAVKIRNERETRISKERKCRESFKALLDEIRHRGEINAYTKWKDCYPKISAGTRYSDILGQTGSSALDLFRDTIVELEDQLYKDRKLIGEVLKVCQNYCTIAWSLRCPLRVSRESYHAIKLLTNPLLLFVSSSNLFRW